MNILWNRWRHFQRLCQLRSMSMAAKEAYSGYLGELDDEFDYDFDPETEAVARTPRNIQRQHLDS